MFTTAPSIPSALSSTAAKIPALFISDAAYLKNSPGGVQICTQEYIQTLRAAGFQLLIHSYSPNTHPLTRLKRKLWPEPYTDRLPGNLGELVANQAEREGIQWIFLNQVDTAPIAQILRKRLGEKCKLVLLSHGLESTDLLHNMRTRGDGANFSQSTLTDMRFLAQSLVAEYQHRQFLDHIFCLSPFETELEHWLGAKQVNWLPRLISNQALPWQPKGQRLGFVGTVNHPPNREGLLRFLEALQPIAPAHLRVRLVGGPEVEAQAIAQRFPIVEYLGRLSDAELAAEASTWNAFVHPLFCYSRGCSTKLAVALGWQIPILTTPSGMRGYRWQEGALSVAETPADLAKLSLSLLKTDVAKAAQAKVVKIVHSSPTLEEIALQIQSNLLSTLTA